MISLSKLSKIKPPPLFIIVFKILICNDQLIKHTFTYVNQNYSIYSSFKGKVLKITLTMLEQTQEQEIINFPSWK